MIELASKEFCTGCGACAFVCPKHCIELKEDEMHVLYPSINDEECVRCGKCQKVCPVLNPVELNAPVEVYAARSTDKGESSSSASGGVACALYRDALNQGNYIAGAVQKEDFSVELEAGNQESLVSEFKNSKYVFSSALNVYSQISALLKNNENIVVAGLPCQIAAIRKIFRDSPNLYLIDIVCHGSTPTDYLQQHIRIIEDKVKQKAVRMSFRDAKHDTSKFFFTLYNSADECFYAKRTKNGDTYQYGYHRAISYRENCYNCMFAQTNRTGDISLADYPGLGIVKPFPYDRKNINCVLVNSEKGKLWFEDMVKKGMLEAYLRPLKEAINGNKQLRKSVVKSRDRLDFEKKMRLYNGDFEKSMCFIAKRGLIREKLQYLRNIPVRAVNKIKRIIKRYL